MLKAVRHEALLSLLEARGHATIQDVVDALGVSPATARRDIAELETRNALERTWGGVRLVSAEDDPFSDALSREGDRKQRIARAAASMVDDGSAVILDIGTTVLYLALALAEREITVLTASLPVFDQLRSHRNIRVILLGGQWSERYQCFEGPQVADALSGYQAELAFIGCSGIGSTGRIRDTTVSQVPIKKAIMASATRSVLLADATKLPGRGAYSPGSLDEIDGLVTDATTVNSDIASLCKQSTTEVHFV